MEKVLKNIRTYFLHNLIQPKGPIIMIWYIRNLQIICDRFPFPIFNNYILLVDILFIRDIVVVWLKSNFLFINFWSIISVTSIVTLILFIHIYYLSSGRYTYNLNERQTRGFILLVLPIFCPSTTWSRTWRWWLLWGKIYPTVIAWLIYVCKKNLLAFVVGMLTLGGYSCRGIPSGTLVMYHLKTNVWIPELGKVTFKTCS